MEEDWIRRSAEGDHGAFALLVEKYQGQVYSLAYRLLGDRGEAEDAAQEVFLRVYLRLKDYDSKRQFSTWLFAIASHHCIDRLRRRRLVISLEDLPPKRSVAVERSPIEGVVLEEEQAEIRQLLLSLSPEHRLVVVLRYWHDLSYAEIAGITGEGEGAIKSRLHRARRILAQGMKGSLVGRVALEEERCTL